MNTYKYLDGPMSLSEHVGEVEMNINGEIKKIKKHIYIFGDHHEKVRPCGQSKNSVNITEFIIELAKYMKYSNKTMDIFLEDIIRSQHGLFDIEYVYSFENKQKLKRSSKFVDRSEMINFMKILSKCEPKVKEYYKTNKTPLPYMCKNLRVHLSDIRLLSDQICYDKIRIRNIPLEDAKNNLGTVEKVNFHIENIINKL